MQFSEDFYSSLDKLGTSIRPVVGPGSGTAGRTETLSDLENDPLYQEDAEKYLTYLATSTTGWRKFLDAGSWTGQDDIFETLRDEDYRLGTIATRADQLKEAPDDVKQAYARLRSRFDEADIGKGNRLKAFFDIGTDVIADPINLVSVLFGLKGVGANASARQGIAQTLKRIATENSKEMATVRGAVGGAAWTGLDNYYRQNAELATGLRRQFDTMENGAYAAGGALLGGGLGRFFGVTKPSATRQRTLDKAVDEESIGDKIDADIEVEVVRDSRSFASNALPSGRTFEGEFEEVLEEEIVSLSKKYGGGEATKGELYDSVRQVIKENQGATGEQIQSLLAKKIARTLHGLSPTRAFVEKPASILDSYTKFSKTAAMLQKKFRYDLGRSWTGKREVEDRDFFETFGDIRGDRLLRIKEALEPFNLHLKGDALDQAKQNVVRALRGEEENISPSVAKAASEIRLVLDEIGDDLVGYGIIDDLVGSYVPRMWDRKAIFNNYDEFADTLVEAEVRFTPKGTKDSILITDENVNEFIDGMLDIENRLDLGSNSSFFSSRTLEIKDDKVFEKFLDNNIESLLNAYTAQTSKSIAKTKVFGVRDIKGFKELWVDQIGKEMKEAGQKAFTVNEQEAILDVYRTATGEGVSKFGDRIQAGLDWYVLGTRLALLPLATLSSLTEVAINISKAGFKNSTKGFAKAFNTALTTVTDDTVEDLMTRGLTRSEAFKEMNKVNIAMDQALADGAERLSGEALSTNAQRKVNNVFFRANFLDQWTKFVQLTSFTTAKELINDNLGKIAGAIDSPTARTQKQMDELIELGLDVNKALDWYNAGAKRTDDFYQNDIIKAAGRYTNEVILNPSPEAGVKPNLMSNPKSAILFQLMGYPAAFTNVILKRFVTDTVRDPAGNLPKIASSAIIMTGMAATTNYIRSHGQAFEDKDSKEIIMDAIARWGGNGLILDQYERASKSSKYYQSTGAFITGLGGPVVGDVYRAIRLDAFPAQVAGKKFVPYAAIEPVFGEEPKDVYDDTLRDIDKAIREMIVPDRDPKEFDPYKAFNSGGIVEFFKIPNAPEVPRERVDKVTGVPYDEQAEDPLVRLGMSVGGKLVGKIANVIKELSLKDIDDDNAKKAAEQISERARAFSDNKAESELIAEERVRAVMEGRTLSDPQDLDMDIEQVLDSIEAREVPEDSFIKSRALFNFSQSIRKGRTEEETSPQIEEEKLKEAIENLKTSDDEDLVEASRNFNKLLLRMPKSERPVLNFDISGNRSESIKEFVKDSAVKVPVYRTTGDGIETDFEINFAFPREIGPHFGTKSQADEIFNQYMDNEARTPEQKKGYINIKNPLVLDVDYGSWDAATVLATPRDLKSLVTAIAKQSGDSPAKIEKEIATSVKPLVKSYYRMANRIDIDNETYELAKHIANSQANLGFKKYLQLKGFDSVMYKNTGEDNWGDFSYLLFEPTQFKMSTAAQFDPSDPRMFKVSGGKVLASLKALDSQRMEFSLGGFASKGVTNILGKLNRELKNINKKVSSAQYIKERASIDEAETPKEWKAKAKQLVKDTREIDPVVRTPELEKSAQDFQANLITRGEHLENIDLYKPVTPFKQLTAEPSDKALVFSLDDKQIKQGFFVLDPQTVEKFNVAKSPLSIGDFFRGRLDIPAYNSYDTWIVAGKAKGLDGTHYAKAMHYVGKEGEPVTFTASQKAEKILTGQANKDTIAFINGFIKDLDPVAIRKKADELLRDPEWTQVGFDPRRQTKFYVREGDMVGTPVKEAEEVIQIGPLVLAKNVVMDTEHTGLAVGGLA